MKKKLKELISIAIAKHRKLGLSITHKVHLIEDHVVEQFWALPFAFFYFIEEFVEKNHQVGKKEEDNVKRIKDADARATFKAKRLWVSRSRKVRKYIHAVSQHDKRGPYKKKEKQTVVLTPPFFPRPHAAVTNEEAVMASVDRAEEDHSDSEQPLSELVSAAADYSPPPEKRQKT